MPQTTPLSERHAGLDIFKGWPVSALRTLRAAAVYTFDHGSGDGHTAWAFDEGAAPLKHIELCWRSKWLGEPMSQATASQGSRFLAGTGYLHSRHPPLGERWGHPFIFQLNEMGLTFAAISLEHSPPLCSLERKVEVQARPPDPATPLWRVLGSGTEYLVLAADAARAAALVEREHDGEMVVRATPIDTSAELILGFEAA